MAYKDVILHDKQENDLYPVTRASNVYNEDNTSVAESLTDLQNNKQNILSASQQNAVNSGVTSSTVAQVATNTTNISQLSNPNLLINGDFRVNQRGQTSYTGGVFGVDRWKSGNNDFTVTKTTTGVTVTTTNNGWYRQDLENEYSQFAGKNATISCKVNGVIFSATALIPAEEPSAQTDLIYTASLSSKNSKFRLTYISNRLVANFYIYANDTLSIEWVKLEIGSIATPFSPRPYAEELALCQRYYQKISSGTVLYGRTGFGADTTCVLFIPLPVTMRTKYTTTITGDLYIYGNGQTKTPTNLAFSSQILNGFRFTADIPTGIGAKQVVVLEGANVELDAEIY